VAAGLERTVERADSGRRPALSAAVPGWRPGVLEARGELLTLAGRLRSDAPVDVQAMASLTELMSDGCSPVYVRSHPQMLAVIAAEIVGTIDVE
jgi:hypothetical protein